VTDDYGYLNILKPFKAIDEGTRRKTVYPDDLLKYYKKWDKQLLKIFPLMQKVNQPLYELLTSEIREEISLVTMGEKQMASIISNYCFSDSQKGGQELHLEDLKEVFSKS
jgi:hypothetical protein